MESQMPWENNSEVPERFQAVARGEEKAGPHSVKAAHMASHSHPLRADGDKTQHSHQHQHHHSHPASQAPTKSTGAETTREASENNAVATSQDPGSNSSRKEGEPMPQEFNEVSASGHIIDGETGTTQVSEADVLEAMRDVIDPELGINIVDLGLVYGVNFAEDGAILLDMTLTSAACPLTDMLEQQTQMVLSTMTSRVEINWVWMPPWGPDRITPEGREQLRALGFNV